MGKNIQKITHIQTKSFPLLGKMSSRKKWRLWLPDLLAREGNCYIGRKRRWALGLPRIQISKRRRAASWKYTYEYKTRTSRAKATWPHLPVGRSILVEKIRNASLVDVQVKITTSKRGGSNSKRGGAFTLGDRGYRPNFVTRNRRTFPYGRISETYFRESPPTP